MRVAAVVHVFYADMWPELATCVRNLGDCDLTVTYVDEAAVGAARRDFPAARFIRCANRGYDVWPFVVALQRLDLDRLDVVVKLHTKRNIDREHPFFVGSTRLNGDVWREHLLSFCKTPEAWRRTCACLADPRVGMVASRHLVYGRRDSGKSCYDAAVRELRAAYGLSPRRRGHFVGGTMFAVRAGALKLFALRPPPETAFAESGSHESTTYAHLMERMLGLAVEAQGLEIAAFDGSVTRKRLWSAVRKFFFDNRWSERRHSVRICGVTVYLRRLSPKS